MSIMNIMNTCLVEVRETFNDTDTTIDQNSIIHQGKYIYIH